MTVIKAAAPSRRRRRVLPVALQLLSLAGLVMSVAGGWVLLTSGPRAAIAAAPSTSAVPSTSDVQSPSTASPSDAPISPTPSAPVDPLAAWPTCSNLSLGYELSYPVDWFTVATNARRECRYFDEEPFAIAGGELPETAIRIYMSDRTYQHLDRVLDGETNPDVLDRLNVKVDGHRAFRVEVLTSSTKFGEVPLYAYVIDLGRNALVLDCPEPFSPDYGDVRARLDDMVSTLRFLSGDGS